MRERLIELLLNCYDYPKLVYYDLTEIIDKFMGGAEHLADYLLANGVVVLPCKVYQTDGVRVCENEVTKVIYRTKDFDFDEKAIGNSIFLSEEEAETALERSKQ